MMNETEKSWFKVSKTTRVQSPLLTAWYDRNTGEMRFDVDTFLLAQTYEQMHPGDAVIPMDCLTDLEAAISVLQREFIEADRYVEGNLVRTNVKRRYG
jgi:hypothetical protein|tara:strand:+ start:1356 stop:1649 length:294 start_codon:yes stop_codon:yes gene_type:complete